MFGEDTCCIITWLSAGVSGSIPIYRTFCLHYVYTNTHTCTLHFDAMPWYTGTCTYTHPHGTLTNTVRPYLFEKLLLGPNFVQKLRKESDHMKLKNLCAKWLRYSNRTVCRYFVCLFWKGNIIWYLHLKPVFPHLTMIWYETSVLFYVCRLVFFLNFFFTFIYFFCLLTDPF